MLILKDQPIAEKPSRRRCQERVMHFSTPAMNQKRPEREASGPRRISRKIRRGPLNEAGGPFPVHLAGGMELAPLLRRDRSMGLRTRFSQSLLAAEPIPCRRGGAKVHNTLYAAHLPP
jgi:hypothetical protein